MRTALSLDATRISPYNRRAFYKLIFSAILLIFCTPPQSPLSLDKPRAA